MIATDFLTLGTAQFGMQYGVVNHLTVPNDREFYEILSLARRAGIERIDTAPGYGNAEARLGGVSANTAMRICTKIPSLGPLMHELNTQDIRTVIMHSLDKSLAALGIEAVDTLFLHNPDDGNIPYVLDALCEARDAGKTRGVGMSVYRPEEAMEWLENDLVTDIQLPCHPLDRRWNTKIFEEARRSRNDVTIHARTTFLQGLLLAPVSSWPDWAHEAQGIVSLLDLAAEGLNKGRVELCLRYHRTIGWVDQTIIGVASRNQLANIISAASVLPLPSSRMEIVKEAAALASKRLLDPRLW